ncbi:hypothetical protein F4782DRAFT_510137 [Xylaria castorea]|nr:hypothetical protein F4782DRAFT_510137 [Xylaria castorea]
MRTLLDLQHACLVFVFTTGLSYDSIFFLPNPIRTVETMSQENGLHGAAACTLTYHMWQTIFSIGGFTTGEEEERYYEKIMAYD